HLYQELIQRLLALVVAAKRVAAPAATDRVELVDEHDRGGRLLGLAEQLPDPTSADPDDHLDELGPTHAEERYVRLATDRPSQQRFACARRADEQHALRNRAAQAGVLRRVLEEIDHFDQLSLNFVDSCYVGERDAGGVRTRVVASGAASAEESAGGGGAAHDPQKAADQKYRGAEGDEQVQQRRPWLFERLGVDLDVMVF